MCPKVQIKCDSCKKKILRENVSRNLFKYEKDVSILTLLHMQTSLVQSKFKTMNE